MCADAGCTLVTTGHYGLGYNQISRTADDKLDTGRVLGTRDHWPLGGRNFDIDTVRNTQYLEMTISALSSC